MKCPRKEDWDLLALDALEEAPADALRAHALQCPACREIYAVARREHIDRVRLYEAFDQGHDELREQLMAALPAEAPRRSALDPLARGWYRLGDYVMRLNTQVNRRAAVVLVPAACLVLAVIIVLGSGSRVAFATVLERMRRATTIVARYQLYQGDEQQPTYTGKLYMADGRGCRFDATTNGAVAMSVWSQPDRVTSLLSGPVKTAISLKRSGPESVFGPPQGNRPDEFFQRFLSLSEVADRCLGRSVIEGREVIGYEVSARKLGFEYLQAGAGKDGQVATVAPGGRLWVDVKTGQPVRLEFETDDSWSGRRVRMVFDQFEWNVPLEDQLFVPDLPPDTRVIEATMPPLTEQTLLDGLRLYASLGHGYPTVLDGSRLTAEVAAGLLAQGKLDRSNPLSAETVQAGLTMTQACAFCQKLARDGREPEYFGDQVTPEDSDQVLMRWRLDDGQVRVIYGDLRAETLPDEK